MAYKITHNEKVYEARKCLEGPFRYSNGRVLYYDPAEGRYWDPTTDFYMENDEIINLQNNTK